jgi:hypothetical protein
VIVALVITALVVVELPTTRLVMLARVATRDEKKPLVEVLFVERRSVKLPLVAEKLVVKKLVLVALSVDRLSANIAPAVRLEIVVVANVVVLDTVRFPTVETFPLTSTRKLRFSVHFDPSQ